MPNNRAVPIFWLSEMVHELEPHRNEVDDALARIGLSRDHLHHSENKVHQEQEADFLGIMSGRIGRPFLGAEVGLVIDLRRTSLLSYLIYNSVNIGHALENLIHFLPLVRPSSKMAVDRSGAVVRFRFSNLNAKLMYDAQYMEFAAAMILNSLRRASGVRLFPRAIRFAHARKEGGGRLAREFGCEVSFGADETLIDFPDTILDRAVVARDPNLFREMEGYGNHLLSQVQKEDPSLTERLERFLVNRHGKQFPTVAEAAETLGLSSRTLARRLSEMGTSYRAFSEKIRVEMARTYLRDSDFSLAEVTYLLGYADQSAFGVAFKRATGDTPHQFRKSLTENGS